MQRDAIVQIYSMTKPITGVALMTLYEQGKFKLDDPLAKYLPEFADPKVYAGTDPSGAPTLRPRRAADHHRRHHAPHRGLRHEPRRARRRDASTRAANPLDRTQHDHRSSRRSSRACRSRSSPARAGRTASRSTCRPRSSSASPASRSARYVRAARARSAEDARDALPRAGERSAPPRRALSAQPAGSARTRTPDSTYRAFNTQPWPLEPGAFGLTSTLDDYLRFARMLLNGGELDGVRILKPETVQLMATNHLPATVKDSSFLPSKGQVGFGIDFAVRVAPPKSAAENNGAVGEFFWDGAREHAVLGRSEEPAHRGALHADAAVRSGEAAQELPRRGVRPDHVSAAIVSSASHRAISDSISADSAANLPCASTTALPSRSRAGSASDAYTASRSRSRASIWSGSAASSARSLNESFRFFGSRGGCAARRCASSARGAGDGVAIAALAHPVGVAARVLADPPASLEHERARDHVVEEGAVVAHEQQRPSRLDQQLLEQVERLDVEIVRRLVEHEQVERCA